MPGVTSGQKLPSLFPARSKERILLDELFQNVAARIRAKELNRRTAGDHVENFLKGNRTILVRILDLFAQMLGQYSWENDPDFQVKFYSIARALLSNSTQPNQVTNRDELRDFIQEQCARLKDQFERQEKTQSLFHDENGEPITDEMRIQSVIDVILGIKAEDAGLKCERAATGASKPDFEISRGSGLKACVEIKLLKEDSPAIKCGQLEAYQKRGNYQVFGLIVFCMNARAEIIAKARGLTCSFPFERWVIDIAPLPQPSKR
jgi:hypothetical protein